MRIVTQLASVSYSPFPALCAPKIAGLLPAPAVSGLLTAGSAPHPYSRIRQQFDLWHAADAEVSAFLVGAKARLLALQAEIRTEGQVCYA